MKSVPNGKEIIAQIVHAATKRKSYKMRFENEVQMNEYIAQYNGAMAIGNWEWVTRWKLVK